jgi:HEAT repeat protein
VPALMSLARSEDPGIRKAVVHSLGAMPSPETRAALEQALGDAVADVRWNAAIALAREGDAAARPVLMQMLDRDQLSRATGVTPEQVEEALLQAVAATPMVRDAEVRAALERLRASDPSMKVREGARLALEDNASPAP